MSKLERTDWGVRARYDWTDWLQAGAFLQRSSIGVGERGEIAEPDEPRVNRDARSQLGAHMAVRGGSWWIEGEYRSQGGPGWPSGLQAIHGSGTLDAIGGATFSAERQSWDRGDAAVSYDARLWTRSLLGFSLFGEIVKGSRGVSFYVPPDPVEDPEGEQPAEPEEPEAPELPDVSLTERTGIRGGVRYEAGEFQVSAALLSIEADSLHPTGLPPDRDVTPTQGGSRSGFEFSANVPLRRLVGGLYLRGSAQFWGEGETWRYLPDRSYEARLSFHDVFYESENLELWVDAGVTGRDPMEVPWEGSQETVPFQQSWFGRLQVRVSSVRLFVRFDNFTVRDMNQDYPGRLTPRIRSMYGIRWTLWN